MSVFVRLIILTVTMKNILKNNFFIEILSLMWNDINIAVDVIAPMSERSSISSDGSKSCPQNGEAKFPTHVRHSFTTGCSPFL